MVIDVLGLTREADALFEAPPSGSKENLLQGD
jgi:hypothetical protein